MSEPSGEQRDEPLTFMGIPIRSDATLCEPGEIWFELPNGESIRVWPLDADTPKDHP